MHSHASCKGRVPSKGHQSTNRNVLVKLVLLLNMLNVDDLCESSHIYFIFFCKSLGVWR